MKLLTKLRKIRGLTQTELAALSGVSQSTISLLERADGCCVSDETLSRIADVLELHGWDDDPSILMSGDAA